MTKHAFISILGAVSVAALLLVGFSTRIGALPSLMNDYPASASSIANNDTRTTISSFLRLQSNEYQRLLDEFPLVTKSATAGLVSFFGDLLAQSLIAERRASHDNSVFDWNRAATVAAEGLFVAGPLLHLAYDWMDEHLTSFMAETSPSQGSSSSIVQSLVQVMLDIFIMDSFFAMTLLLVSAILQRRTRRQIYDEIRTDYGSAILAAWSSSLLMSPVQFCNFQFVPIQFRVLITNFQDVIWNACVSWVAHRNRGDPVVVVAVKSKSA